MHRFVKLVIVSVGSWLGWWVGSQANIWWALLLSTFGAVAGWYVHHRYLSGLME